MGLEDKLSAHDKHILDLVKKYNLTPAELKLILTQPKRTNVSNRTYDHSQHTKHSDVIRFGVISDTHIGHEKFDEELFKSAGDTFRQQGIKRVYHAGDIVEGMSGRDGHIYELKQIGFSQQVGKTAELIQKYFNGLELFAISGNHDGWYLIRNNGGVSVGEVLDAQVPNFHYLGESEADVKLADGVIMKLFHANDGTAYADSYKLQKLIESFEGGHKPQIVLSGHYHKSMYMFRRNVHALECGTLCGQSKFMRGKKMQAHKGFWIADVEIGKKGIKKFSPTFYPSYD